jgi:hypothetical protein
MLNRKLNISLQNEKHCHNQVIKNAKIKLKGLKIEEQKLVQEKEERKIQRF